MAATNRDFIAQFDAAIGCQQCGGALGDSPSDDFCSPRCQTAWSAARATMLTAYREPNDQAAHVSNQVELHHPETCARCVERRRRREAIQSAMTAALTYGSSYVVTDEVAGFIVPSRNARREFLNGPGVGERGGSLAAVTRRDGVDHVEVLISPGGFLLPSDLEAQAHRVAQEVGEAWSAAWLNIEPVLDEAFRAMSTAVGEACRAIAPLAEALADSPPDDPRERALWLRRNRNTGPAVSARAPRAINPRGRR